MADPFDDAFDSIGADYEALMAGLKPVTIESVEPEAGAALVTVEDVPALKRGRRRFPFRPGEGELPGDQTRFVFAAHRIEFALKHRDRITDAAGVVWTVDERGANLIANGQLWTVDVTKYRG